jgi:type II secretory pathway pseudopilin PulG
VKLPAFSNPVGPRCAQPDAPPPCRRAGFTMVEIALCLAIIGFALVAILGVLPIGLNVQRRNREETIINQDAAVWLEAMRNGMQGDNELTNYVISITNFVWHYSWNNNDKAYKLDPTVERTGSPVQYPEVNVFTRTAWIRNGQIQSGDPQFLLTNGMHIIGLLNRPKIEWEDSSRSNFFRNLVVANVRAISGSAVDKYPQNNGTILDEAFKYRMIPQIEAQLPVGTNDIMASLVDFYLPFDVTLAPPNIPVSTIYPFDPTLGDIPTNVILNMPPFPPNNTPVSADQRKAFWDHVRDNRRVMRVAYDNSHDVRLTFRWPLLVNGDAGMGRHTYRVFTAGQLYATNDPAPGVLKLPLYFFQPSTYVQQ